MRIAICTASVSLLISLQASADIVERYWRDTDGARRFELVDDSSTDPAAGQHAYDNWRGPNRGGVSLFPRGLSEFPIGTAEIGDDLYLIPTGPSTVSDIGFSYMNASTTSVITHFRSTIRFYNHDLLLVGIDAFDHDLALQPGVRVAIFSDSYFYLSYNIPVTSLMYMSVQFTDIVGAGPNDMGMVVGGPITTGNSSQYLRNFTTGEPIDLGTTEQKNLRFFIDTVSVPSPLSIAGLLAGLGTCLRRRR